MVGMSASAASKTVIDSYSKFYYYRNNTSAGCTLTNTTSTNRYVQASMTVYTADGTAFPRDYDPFLGYLESVSCRMQIKLHLLFRLNKFHKLNCTNAVFKESKPSLMCLKQFALQGTTMYLLLHSCQGQSGNNNRH